jgi:hypothetical protein
VASDGAFWSTTAAADRSASMARCLISSRLAPWRPLDVILGHRPATGSIHVTHDCLGQIAGARAIFGFHDRTAAGEGLLEQSPQTARIGGRDREARHEYAAQNLIPFLCCKCRLCWPCAYSGPLGCRAAACPNEIAQNATWVWLNGAETVKRVTGPQSSPFQASGRPSTLVALAVVIARQLEFNSSASRH